MIIFNYTYNITYICITYICITYRLHVYIYIYVYVDGAGTDWIQEIGTSTAQIDD